MVQPSEFSVRAVGYSESERANRVPAEDGLAIPKDGPSANITMTTALASVYTGLPARSDTAMTGEVTLTGLVLPIGGLKEKVLAARRSGIHRLILPQGNKKDLREIPDHVRQEMQFHFVDRVEQVLALVIPDLKVRSLAIAS